MQGEQLKFNLDDIMMRQHVEAVHDGNDGYIAFCSINKTGEFHQRHYLYADLVETLDCINIDEHNDYYFSVNSFFKPKRVLENVRQIRALYADIDCHDVTASRARLIIKDAILCLELPCFKERIPTPSLLVKTGRGIQLYWLLEDLPKQAVPLWKLVQDELTEHLTEVFKKLKLDVTIDNVSDIARILRLSGTNNTKVNKMATLVLKDPNRYRLDELIAEYFFELKHIDRPRRKNTDISPRRAQVSYMFNLYSLHYARIQDLVKLLELRKGDVESDECRRRMVFLYRYWSCCYLQDALRALETTLEFNKDFTKPLPQKTVIRETESAEKAYFEWLSGEKVLINGQAYRKGYNYKNSTLIRWLEITPEEQREMQTIISKEEKYRRNDKRRYGKDEDGLTAKQRERLERDKRILAMHEQGLNNCEIGRSIGVSEKTVRRILNIGRHF